MADRNGKDAKPIRTALSNEDGIDLAIIELLFFAYRDFTSDPDQILAEYGFGRAHHRILHFVNRMPGLTVAELLDVLKITKQSLARVLKQLIDTGHVIQIQGPRDRRQRELYPTEKGRALALDLARPQSRRISAALESAQATEREGIEQFLKAMVNPELRAQIDNLPGNALRESHGDE
ncbi:MarR family transcriptional regulator [Mesorhizobium sp. DCY119]|jgi:DNA-binding MarR family transcriptional regulator|uniref:MarR family winged helix-turn-helix transcriptional regulator n=1 Tax=Mesorhizobium sp. DCY119 TaxID=2108445 RepID=UPI000E6CE48B|nr:MarR family transcriptional regulator [Mesorhizobium sp. DCY119]RJG44226.1 MarR family transcriptional regulator [Mesorhizobium sp. DCY119]